MARPVTPAIDRALRAIKVHPLGCWEYQGTLNRDGYGVIGEGRETQYLVHRLVYMHEVGPVGDGLTIDHLCFNQRCCNPTHLEVVTRDENSRRLWIAGRGQPHGRARTHCKRGHPFNAQNTRVYRGKRHCRTCHAEYMRSYNQKEK